MTNGPQTRKGSIATIESHGTRRGSSYEASRRGSAYGSSYEPNGSQRPGFNDELRTSHLMEYDSHDGPSKRDSYVLLTGLDTSHVVKALMSSTIWALERDYSQKTSADLELLEAITRASLAKMGYCGSWLDYQYSELCRCMTFMQVTTRHALVPLGFPRARAVSLF